MPGSASSMQPPARNLSDLLLAAFEIAYARGAFDVADHILAALEALSCTKSEVDGSEFPDELVQAYGLLARRAVS